MIYTVREKWRTGLTIGINPAVPIELQQDVT